MCGFGRSVDLRIKFSMAFIPHQNFSEWDGLLTVSEYLSISFEALPPSLYNLSDDISRENTKQGMIKRHMKTSYSLVLCISKCLKIFP